MSFPTHLTDHHSLPFLNHVFNCHPEGLAWVDEHGYFRFANPAFIQLLLTDSHSYQQLRWSDISLVIEEEHFQSSILPQLQQKDSTSHFLIDRWLRCNDTIIDTHIHVSAIWDEHGQWNGLLLTAKELGADDRSELILASVSDMIVRAPKDDLFDMLVENIADLLQVPYVMISTYDPVSQQAQVLSMFAQGEVVNNMEMRIEHTPCSQVIYRIEAQIYPQQVQEFFPNSQMCKMWDIQAYIGVPFVDSNKQVLGYLAMMDSKPIEDIELAYQTLQIYSTKIASELERRKKEKELVESEEKFRIIYEESPIGIVLECADNVGYSNFFSEFNSKVPEILGYSPEELRQLTIADVTYQEDIDKNPIIEEALRQHPEQTVSVEKRFVKKGGEVIWVNVSVSTIHRNGQKWRIALMRDIHSQKMAEQQLTSQTEKLDKKNQELKQYIESNLALENFAYIASHDLKEPLRTIGNFSQLLQRRYAHLLDESGQDFIRFISEGAKNMHRLIDDILLFSRINTKDFEVEEIDVPHLIQEIVDSLHQLVSEKEADISYTGLPQTLKGNRTKIKQLFQNLIANAIKFHKPNQAPKIEITCRRDDNHHLFSVKDHGIGIREEFFDKIFLIFKKLHNPRQYDGTGIGLALCKRIVDQHNGQIWLESTEGEGTCFYFSLPIEQVALS